VLANGPVTARAMNEEPFGPIVLLNHFDNLADAIDEATRLPYGLAAFVYTRSLRTVAAVTERLEAGMVAVNRVFSRRLKLPSAASRIPVLVPKAGHAQLSIILMRRW
jgi:acyl-CoA reductase-like NAD-dependent aldehyde dehydrogenase